MKSINIFPALIEHWNRWKACQAPHSVFLAVFIVSIILIFRFLTKPGSNYIFSILSRELEYPLFVFDEYKVGDNGTVPYWMLDDITTRLRLIVGFLTNLGVGLIAAAGFFGILIKRLNFRVAVIIFIISALLGWSRTNDSWNKGDLKIFFMESIIVEAEKQGRVYPGILGQSKCVIRSVFGSGLNEQKKMLNKFLSDSKGRTAGCTVLVAPLSGVQDEWKIVGYDEEGQKISLVFGLLEQHKKPVSESNIIELAKAELARKNIIYSTTDRLTKPYRINLYVNFSVITLMVFTFVLLCFRSEKWYKPSVLLQRKRMVFAAIAMGITLLSVSAFKNESFFSWPASLLAEDQQKIALEIANSYVSLIGSYHTIVLLSLTIPVLIALELDIQRAAIIHNADDENCSQYLTINNWRDERGLSLPAKSVIISALGSLAPMLIPPFSNFMTTVLTKIG